MFISRKGFRFRCRDRSILGTVTDDSRHLAPLSKLTDDADDRS